MVSNLTSKDDDGNLQVARIGFINEQRAGNEASVIDHDGSLTGTPGALLTPGLANGVNAINSAPGAYYLESQEAWVTEATVGVTQLIMDVGDLTNDLTIVRSDGLRVQDIDPVRDWWFEFGAAAGTERDVAYLLDFEDMPSTLTIDLQNVGVGDSVVYEIPSIAGSYSVTEGGTRAFSFDELLNSDSSTYYRHNESGSVFVRLVAEDLSEDLPIDDYLGDFRAGTSLTLNITGDDSSSSQPGQRELTPALLDAIEAQPARDVSALPEVVDAALPATDSGFELERYESTSNTTVVTDDMARWSDAATWGGADAPGANTIVVIGPDQTVILDQSTTVKGIIVNGGELIVEDDANMTIGLSTDYLLVINGGLLQAGTEDDLLDTDFTLTLEGDDPDMDLEVTQILQGNVANTVMAVGGTVMADPDPIDEDQPVIVDEEPDPVDEEQPVIVDEEPDPVDEEEPVIVDGEPDPVDEEQPVIVGGDDPYEEEPQEPEEPIVIDDGETGNEQPDNDYAFRMYIIDTDTDEVVVEIDDASNVPLDLLEGRNLSVSVEFEDDVDVGSVALTLNGGSTQIENVTPYALFGNRGDDFYGGTGDRGRDAQHRRDDLRRARWVRRGSCVAEHGHRRRRSDSGRGRRGKPVSGLSRRYRHERDFGRHNRRRVRLAVRSRRPVGDRLHQCGRPDGYRKHVSVPRRRYRCDRKFRSLRLVRRPERKLSRWRPDAGAG